MEGARDYNPPPPFFSSSPPHALLNIKCRNQLRLKLMTLSGSG